MLNKTLKLCTIIAATLVLAACGSDQEATQDSSQHASLDDKATAGGKSAGNNGGGTTSNTGQGNDDSQGNGKGRGDDTSDAGTADSCGCDDSSTDDDDGSAEDDASDDDDGDDHNDASADQGLTVEQDLAFLREEEKLARDVYLRLYDQWSFRVFENIAKSEQAHMDAVKLRLDALGVSDPVVDDSVGVFANDELAHLYDELVAKGLRSKVAALEVGATIEDLDILDIEEMKHRTTDEAVLRTYDNLVCGSGNHLRAFVGLLEANDETYQAQFNTQADLDAILAQPHQQCGRR